MIVAGVISTGAVTLSTHAASATPRDLPPGPVYGVTIDDIANISSVVSAAEAMPDMSTTRVYLDPTEPARLLQVGVAATGAAHLRNGRDP